MRKNAKILLCGLIYCLPGYVSGYGLETHATISENAAKLSVLGTDPKVLQNLGFASGLNNLFFPNGEGEVKRLLKVIGDGARFEDDTPRFLNHFYDPAHNHQALTVGGFALGFPSPDWALEDVELKKPSRVREDTPFPEPQMQQYSLQDARDYLYQALTLPDAWEREQNFGLLFRAFGHVTHHIADMAQPQHVRNDAHLSFESVEWPAIETPSHYEYYTEDVHKQLPMTGYDPVVFSKGRDYWHTNTIYGQGLADYTNQGFVSEGTNFRDEKNKEQLFNSPDLRINQVSKHTVDIQTLYQQIGQPVPTFNGAELQGTVDFIGTTVIDYHRPPLTGPNDKTSTFSIFNTDLNKYNKCVDYYETDPNDNNFNRAIYKVCKLYTLNRFNFDAAHKFLIPRAVGYGAGLINHFFRGKLKISPPDEGYYFDLEQIAQKRISTVKLNLTNQTPTINGVVQNMSGGKLVLVAKYRYNLCYVSGWYCPSKEEFISVSKEQTLNLAAQATQLLTFDLSHEPIPINVTDLSFQVVYKGQLGKEETPPEETTKEETTEEETPKKKILKEEAVVVASYSPTYQGKIEISLPDEGLYSIVDHATVNEIDQGFSTVKLNLKNRTPDLFGEPQPMIGGKLVLIAKYYRNECYQPDLTGEYSTQELNWRWQWVPARKPKCTNQEPYQEVFNVSAVQPLPSVLEPQAEPIPLTFEFSTPIPLNATNLFFQVLYQGQLGEYKVMMSVTRDIAEPTYFSVMNVRDYFVIDNTYYPVNEILANSDLLARLERNGIKGYQPNNQNGDRDITPSGVKVELWNRHNNQDDEILLASVDQLEPATYFRVALLVDRGSYKLSYWEKRTGYLSWDHKPISKISKVDQKIVDGSHPEYILVGDFRGAYHWNLHLIAETLEYTTGADPDVMGPLAPENLAPKPVTIHFGAQTDK